MRRALRLIYSSDMPRFVKAHETNRIDPRAQLYLGSRVSVGIALSELTDSFSKAYFKPNGESNYIIKTQKTRVTGWNI